MERKIHTFDVDGRCIAYYSEVNGVFRKQQNTPLVSLSSYRKEIKKLRRDKLPGFQVKFSNRCKVNVYTEYERCMYIISFMYILSSYERYVYYVLMKGAFIYQVSHIAI